MEAPRRRPQKTQTNMNDPLETNGSDHSLSHSTRHSVAALKRSNEQLVRAISRIDMNIGGLTEATLSRFSVEELERSGARV